MTDLTVPVTEESGQAARAAISAAGGTLITADTAAATPV